MQISGVIRIFLCGVVVLAASAATPLCAQVRISRRAQLDSIAHPIKARGAEAMVFDQTTIMAGTHAEDASPTSYTYRWSNKGAQPIVITQVQTTCSCVTVAFGKEPVLPGKQGWITATLHPKGHPGSFNRRLVVYTHLSKSAPTALLSLQGDVAAPEGLPWGFRVAMGDLQLSRDKVIFDGLKGTQSASILCRNGGKRMLTVAFEEGFLPAGFSARCEPERLKPDEEALLTIHFESTPNTPSPSKGGMLLLKEENLPPSKRSIRIEIDK